jgi:hypothetical protein
LNEADLAKEIFSAWDEKMKGYLTMQQVTDQLISMGVADDPL